MMSSLIKVPEISRTMQELSREMMKAGIVEEMIEDTMESVGDQEELEEEAQKEVDKVSINHYHMQFLATCSSCQSLDFEKKLFWEYIH